MRCENSSAEAPAVGAAGFDSGGFPAAGAAEGIREEDGKGDADAVAAEEFAGGAVDRAVEARERADVAERAAGAEGKPPLDDADQHGKGDHPQGPPHVMRVADGDGVGQKPSGGGNHQEKEDQGPSGELEPEDRIS